MISENKKDKPKIAIFIGTYLPGNKAGGPIRSIESIIKLLGNQYDFYVFCQDRDLGDASQYSTVAINEWIQNDLYCVIYLSKDQWTIGNLKNFIQLLAPQIVYVNSFFSPLYAQKLYILKLCGMIEAKLLIAPRGEFSVGALNLKFMKKYIYLALYRAIYRPKIVNWHASTLYEKQDVLRVLPSAQHIFIAEDISNIKFIDANSPKRAYSEQLSISFISRISPKKNLLFALETLLNCKISLIFDVYGPIEDTKYWNNCLQLAKRMPDNVKFSYKGLLSHNEVQDTFSKYDIFLFPTFGENYGHVIVEALASGCQIMTSKYTPWNDLQACQAGWNYDLVEENFLNGLYEYAALSKNSREDRRKSAIEYARVKFSESSATGKTIDMFDTIIGRE
ncbi:glycosyltransferase family 4 protein [Deinococcus altitudinis]|uniref:glycosyltransferase family 4 protein n=1 Tax=Deinococcus altitudinis TaxID=468914 RepID=UPI003892AA54